MISDLQSLRLALRDYVERNDMPDPTLDLFIDVGRRSAARVMSREQEAAATLTLAATPTNGSGTFFSALPPRFMAARRVSTADGRTLPQMSSAFVDSAGEPGYRIFGASYIEVFGEGLAVGDQIRVDYFEFPSPLVAAADTNTFLQANADLWLWHAVAEAARYLRNEELAQAAAGAIEQIGGGIEKTAREGRQHGGPRRMIARG